MLQSLPVPLNKAKYDLYKRNFKYFVKDAWDTIEPPGTFKNNWHVDAICEHLQAITRREIRRLLINIPPRCMKSTLVSVMWPAWVWAYHPEERFLCASYAQGLSTRDSLKCRNLIQSPWYQSVWGHVYRLKGDQNTKIRFDNDKSGFRLATSVGGLGTGEGGSIITIDDPQSARDAFSEAKVIETMDWFDNTMSTRGNDPKTVCTVIVMQRLSEKDLSQHVLDQGGYEHLMLPMEFETDRKCITSLGWEDPRKEEGELLWPERFDDAAVDRLKKTLSSYAYAGQEQQRPAPKGGGMFQRSWFEVVKAVPANTRKVRYWDRAATVAKNGKDPDWTVGLKMSKDRDGIHYIEDIRRFRESSLKVRDTIKNTATQDGYTTKVRLEQEPGGSGKSEVESLIRFLSGFNAKPDLVQRDKITRAGPLSAHCEAGNVKLVAGSWNEDFLKELEVFPFGGHDDQVDAASGAYNSLNEPGLSYEDLVTL